MSHTEFAIECVSCDGGAIICVPKRSAYAPKRSAYTPPTGGGATQKAEAAAAKKQQQNQAKARQRPGTGPQKTSSKVKGPCPVEAPPQTHKTGTPITMRWVAIAVAVIIVALVVTTYAEAIATALTYLALTGVILGALRLAWGLRDAVPEINWSYYGTWKATRRNARKAIEARRAEWITKVEEDRTPIALPSPRPSNMHDSLMRDWVDGPSHWDEREHQVH